MRYSIHSICDRLRERKKYVNSWTVLFVDILLSVGSSFVALLFVDNFIVDLSRNAYLFVIVGSFLISLLVFMALGVNKNIIRHATIKSIGKMGVAIFFKEILLLGLVSLVENKHTLREIQSFAIMPLPLLELENKHIQKTES